MQSDRKTESNRQNAQRSTGPIDTEKTRFNATKHGIYSSGGVIEEIDGEDSQELFDSLATQMWEEWGPIGVTEEDLVCQLIESKWRRRRLKRVETNLIRVQIEKASTKWENRKLDQHAINVALINHTFEKDQKSPSLEDLESNTDELKGLIEYVESGKPLTEIPNLSSVIVFVQNWLDMNVKEILGGDNPDVLKTPLGLIEFKKAEVDKIIKTACQEQNLDESTFRSSFLTGLRNRYYITAKEQIRQMRTYEQAVIMAGIPDDVNFAKFSRYDTTLFNQGMKLLHELQRIQSTRLGAHPALPIALDIDVVGDGS